MIAAVAGSCPTLVAPAPARQPALLGCAAVLTTPIDWRQSCSALPVKGASLPQASERQAYQPRTFVDRKGASPQYKEFQRKPANVNQRDECMQALFSSTSIGELEEVVNTYMHDTRVPFKLVHCVALCTRVPKILAAGFSQGGQVAETNMAKARAAQLLLRLLPTFLSQISHTGSMRSLSNMLWGLAKLELPREQVVAIRADELLAAAFARACHPKTMEGELLPPAQPLVAWPTTSGGMPDSANSLASPHSPSLPACPCRFWPVRLYSNASSSSHPPLLWQPCCLSERWLHAPWC
ncbi:hypothetical protein V8C86DRAFT_366820 [Haematococcus lacustris]